MDHFELKFYDWEKKFANRPFLRQPFGDTWEEYTWAEVGTMARKMATGLKSLNLPPKAHIGLISKNCREWIIADLAILMAGYISVPFFASLTSIQLKEVLALGDVNALFVGKLENWEESKKGVPEDMPIIAFPNYKGHPKVERGYQWNEFINQFEPQKENYQPLLSDLWTIVFTSGTTGTPKGVMLTYEALENTKWSTEELNPGKISFEGNNRMFSYLPLNHIAERVVVEHGTMRYGGSISFAESIDTFTHNLTGTRPTLFFAVPRILNKFKSGILSKMPQSKLNKLLKIPFLSGVIKKKIKTSLGLDASKAVISGAAPLAEPLKQWYKKLDIEITNGYGMTENCAISTILLPNEDKPGSVGKAQPRAEIKIDKETNEILMRGPFLMTGYYNSPEQTAKTIVDGWLKTGDEGKMDDEGYLYITGRVKDTFKTAKGEFIVPSILEWDFTDNENIEQLCVVGLGCPQPMIIVVLSEIGNNRGKLEIQENLSQTLERVNKELPNYQRISTMIIAKEPWTVENNLLTPTLKVKRNVLHQHYEAKMMGWHERNETIIWE